jgi:hypothetical protein
LAALGATGWVSAGVRGTELLDVSAERHIFGAQVPKFFNTHLVPKRVGLFN